MNGLAHVKERKAFGKTLSNLQTIQHKLAEMKTEIVVGRTFTDHCLSWRLESWIMALHPWQNTG